MLRALISLVLLLGIAACDSGQQPLPEAKPALFEVTGSKGERGFLFATIHALPQEMSWKSPEVAEALSRSAVLVVEAKEIAEEGAVAAIFAELAHDGPEPPLSQRIDPRNRARLAALLEKAGASESQFSAVETWAAALSLARSGNDTGSSGFGIDRALITGGGLPVENLEGAREQLSIFDRLPEKEQRDLLDLVVTQDPSPEPPLWQSWARGDMDRLAAETRRGLLADPELREALFTGRNEAWLERIDAMLNAGRRPFVAVGAAHLAGADGLVALLRAKGWTVTRLQ